jgi:hypothetical protein
MIFMQPVTWLMLGIATITFIVAFLLGRDYEKHEFLDETVGVMVHYNKDTDDIEKVIYYYSNQAYDEDMRSIKEEGIEVQENEE